MSYQRKQIITESERNRIRKMYGLTPQREFVFDFVLTENQKYLIIMDQVFVNGGDGSTIGTIWENTYIFNELINESLLKIETLSESVKIQITESINDFVWTKEIVQEWVKDKNVILEGWWDDFKSGASNLVTKIGQGAMSVVGTIFKQGVLPTLRWIRRNAYTNIGMVVDVIIAILSVKSSAIVWIIIVLLDLYELVFNDFDSQDTQRNQMPFFFMIMDIIAAVFSSASSLIFKKSIPALSKGIVSPSMTKYLVTLAEKIPALKGTLSKTAKILAEKMGSGGVMGKLISAIDKGMGMLMDFIGKLLGKQGLKAAATGGAVLGVAKGVEHILPKIDPNQKFGTAIANIDSGAAKLLGREINVDDESSAVNWAKQNGFVQ